MPPAGIAQLALGRRHYVGLDLLRGIAAYGVVLAHLTGALSHAVGFNLEPVATGFLGRAGVEVFFALSGFLIGGILCDLREHTATNYGIFLVRRWMRTLPIYYVAVFFFVFYAGVFEPEPPKNLVEYLTFTQSFFSQYTMTFFRQSWTLAIEEWFYVALTLGVAFSVLLLKLPRGYLTAVLFLIVAGAAMRLSTLPGDNLGVIRRMDAIAYGCLLAWMVREQWIADALYARRWLVGSLAVGGMYLVWVGERFGLLLTTPIGACIHYVLWGVTAAGTVYLFSLWSPRSPTLIKIAAFSAAVSYPIYVWHQGIIWIFWNSRVHAGQGLLHAAMVILLSSAVAYAMHLLVEKPFMRIRPRFREAPTPRPAFLGKPEPWTDAKAVATQRRESA